MLAIEEIDPRVHFANLLLFFVRVSRFHDSRDSAVPVSNDPSVESGIVELHRHERERVSGSLMFFEESLQRLRTRQRDIAGENQDEFSLRVDLLQCLLNRMPGAELFLLEW